MCIYTHTQLYTLTVCAFYVFCKRLHTARLVIARVAFVTLTATVTVLVIVLVIVIVIVTVVLIVILIVIAEDVCLLCPSSVDMHSVFA